MPPSRNSECFYRQAVCRALGSQRGGRAAQYTYLLSDPVWQRQQVDISPPPSESFLSFVTALQGLEDENVDSSNLSSVHDQLAIFISSATEWISEDGSNICCDPLALAVGIVTEIAELDPDVTQQAGGDVLLPLLVVAAHIGAGTDGIRASLNFLSSGVPGLIKARLALASMLRTHLQKCPVDLSFLFSANDAVPPNHRDQNPDGTTSSTRLPRHKQKRGTASEKKLVGAISPTGVELPRHFNWEGYRGYTVLLYLELSMECRMRDICLFKLRVGGGEGIEVNLISGVEVNVTSYPRGGSAHTISASFPKIEMGNGRWDLISISHSLPYLKRPQMRIAVNDVVILEEDLLYPTGGGPGDDTKIGRGGFPLSGSAQWIRKHSSWGTCTPCSVLCEGMVGKLSYAAMFEGGLSLPALHYFISAGPGHLAGMPVPVPHSLHELDKEVLRGKAYKECMEARMLWAYIPFMAPQSGDFVPDIVQTGKPKRSWTDVCGPPLLTQRGGGMRGMGRLAGGVRIDSAYAPTSTCTSSRTGGIYDAWFRAGGVKAVLFIMGCVVDTSINMASECDSNVSSFLASLLGILAYLMKGLPVHREEALQHHAFHMVCMILRRLPRPTSQLNVAVVSACLDFLELDIDSTRNYCITTSSSPSQQCGPSSSSKQTTNQPADLTLDLVLVGAALQGLLLDTSLWLMAPPLLHISLLQRIAARVDCSLFVHALSRYVGVHHLLDVMRFVVAHYDESKPKPNHTGETDGGGSNERVQNLVGKDDDSDIHFLKAAAQTTSFEERSGGSSSSDNDDTLLDLCHRIVFAVISWDLSGIKLPPPPAGGVPMWKRGTTSDGGGFIASLDSNSDTIQREKHKQLYTMSSPLLAPYEITSSGSSSVNAVLSVLHESQNDLLLLTLLRLLLRLRHTHHDELRWTLLLGGFLHVTAPVILGTGRYFRGVREECLTLTIWLLSNVHKGEEELWPFGLGVDPLVDNLPVSSALNASGGNISPIDGHHRHHSSSNNNYFLENKREPLHIALARCIVSAISEGLWEVEKTEEGFDAAIYSSTVMESIISCGRNSIVIERTSQCRNNNPSSTTHDELHSDHSKINVWLVLPFIASVMSICPPNAKERAALYVNMAIKSDAAVRKMIHLHSGSVWIECLVEIAISDKLSSLSNTLTSLINRPLIDSSETETTETETEIPMLQAERHRTRSVNFSPDSTVCEEFALDAIGYMLSDAVLLKHRGSDWKLWHRFLSSLDYAATQQLGGGEIGQRWLESTLSYIIVLVLHRMKRGGRWSSASLDGVAHMVALADERLVSVQTQPYLINCLIEISRGLRGVLIDSSPNFRQGSIDHDIKVEEDGDEDQARQRLRTQAVLRILLRVLVRSLRVAAPVTHMNLAKEEYVKVSISSANESMAALDSLLDCSELPTTAAVQTVLQLFCGFRHAILEIEPSYSEVQNHLSACLMDAVHRHSIAPAKHHGGSRKHHHHDLRSPNATAVRRLLSSAAHCDSIQGIFNTLGPEMDAFTEEISRDLNDFVPHFSTDCDAAVIPSSPCGGDSEPEPEQQPSSSCAVDSEGNDVVKVNKREESSCFGSVSKRRVPDVTQSTMDLSSSLDVGGRTGRASYQLSQANMWSNSKSWLDGHLLLHAQRVEDEKLRIMRSSAAVDKELRHCQKAWVRMSRSAEAELQLSRTSSILSYSGGGGGDCHELCNSVYHLTGLYRNCQWKLPSGLHEGKPPGRIRIALKPVVGGKKRVTTTTPTASQQQPKITSVNNSSDSDGPLSRSSLSKVDMSTEKLGKQLALRSDFIIDITKKRIPEDEIIVTPDVVNLETQPIGPMLPLEEDMHKHKPSALGATINSSDDNNDDDPENNQKDDIFETELDSTEYDATTVQLGRVPLGPSASLRCLPDFTFNDDSLEQKGEAVTFVTPKGNALGRLLIVKNELYFIPNNLSGSSGGSSGGGGLQSQQKGTQNQHNQASSVTGDLTDSATILSWSLRYVNAIYTRRYRLVDSALELFIMTGGLNESVFFDFGVTNDDIVRRDEFLCVLGKICGKGTIKHCPIEVQRLMQAWQERHISNLEYLLGLNTLAGRSFNDLCQYPVLPWVLSCYGDDKEAYDLQNPNCFRDLSKPMGALNDERLKEYLSRYESFQDPDIPPFMYGSHYSTAVGVILHYLVRLEPFASLHQKLHNNTFDVPDRLFSSIPHSWKICTSALSDVKELTPEWYTLPDFLKNINRYDFGKTHEGVTIADVELPKWASDPEDFIHKHRAALESDYVTHNLHKWIDLIFGYKQQGPEAVTAHNVFYYLTYYGAIDLTQIADEGLRHATELQIAHFGQCPMQLFNQPHPRLCQRNCIPRPLSLSLKSIDNWMEEESKALRKSNQIVQPLSRAEVGVRCMRILPDGRILTVNGLGVVELFSYRWRTPGPLTHDGSDNTGKANWPSAAEQNEPAPLHRERASNNPEHLNTQETTILVTDNNKSATSTQRDNKSRGAESYTTGSGQQQNISFLEVERILPSFDVLPRIPLPTGCDNHSSYAPCASGLPHPAPAVFSSLGRLLFSGGHPSGAVLVWELDHVTGAIVAEGSITGHSAPVTCLSLGGMEPSGHDLLLSGSCDCTAMVWELRKLTSIFNLPQLSRTPYRVIRGHSHPITVCCIDVYMGLCLTASCNTVLLHCIASDQLLRVLQPTSLFPALIGTTLKEEKEKSFGMNNEDKKDISNADIQPRPVFDYTAVALSSDGYAVLAFQEVLPHMTGLEYLPDNNSCCNTVSAISLIESFMVNGQSVGRVTVDKGCCHHGLRVVHTLSVIRNLLVAGGDNLLLQVRSVRDLSLVWEMNMSTVAIGRGGGLPSTTATANAVETQWSGERKGIDGGERGAAASFSSVACIEFGPSPETPILLCVGLKDGCMVVQALPGAEQWLSTSMLSTVGNIINLPVRVVKGSVQQAQSLAASGWRRMSKVYRTGEKIVKQEMAEEAQSIVQGVQSKGLVKGIVGYFRPETLQEGFSEGDQN